MGPSTPKKRCGAICRNGNACRRFPLRGADRCRLHGGGAVRPGSFTFKHGILCVGLGPEATKAYLRMCKSHQVE